MWSFGHFVARVSKEKIFFKILQFVEKFRQFVTLCERCNGSALHCANVVAHCSPESEIESYLESEKEKEIEIEKESESESEKKLTLGQNGTERELLFCYNKFDRRIRERVGGNIEPIEYRSGF